MKDTKLIKPVVIFANIFFTLTSLLSGQTVSAQTVSGNVYKVQYTAQFSQSELSFDKLLGHDIVRLKDGDWLSELGKPMLPAKTLQIALPPGMAVKEVKIVDTKEEEISGTFNIFPAQPPRRTDFSDEDTVLIQPDKGTYSSSQPYPSKAVEFSYQTDLAGQGIAVIQLYPVKYVPSEKRLKLYTSISVALEGTPGYQCGDYLSPNIREEDRKTYKQMIKSMVVNPQEVQLSIGQNLKSSMLPPGTFDHVIITSDSFASFFQPLADWHTQKGVKDTIITTEWIFSNYTGADTQKVRAFVIDANSSWGTTYFLLGGENETVPFGYRTYYNDESTPSDQYYSDYDDDWTHEVFVGRVSVEDSTEINTFVNKVLKYEKDPPRTNYPLDVLLIGMDLNNTTHAEELKWTIATYYVPPQSNVTKVYDSHSGNHRDSVLYYLNAGQNLVNHADHADCFDLGTGSFHHFWYISNEDVDDLTNVNQMSIIVSLGCDANYMDLPLADCIAEHFVIYNPDRAGVAFTGNTRSGWSGTDPGSLSGRLDAEWWMGLCDRNVYILGQTLVDSKHHFPTPSSIYKHCEWTFNLLGEPEMPIWTGQPDGFTVMCPQTLPIGTSSFSVHVEDSTTHSAVDSAYVCLWKTSEVYLTGYTDISGNIAFDPSPSTGGVMYVTATKHNYIPHEQRVFVGDFILGDANGDGTIELGDVVYLINYLYKGGSAPFPLAAADANCDGVIEIGDVVYLITYLFRNGPAPAC